MQAITARPVACRSPTVAFQTQALRPRVASRIARCPVLTRAEPDTVSPSFKRLYNAARRC